MEYMADDDVETKTQGKILCCQCGILIDPNPSNMCVACLRSQVDISEGIPKQVVIYFCKGCERYQQQQGQWIVAELESRELLSHCLKKLKGLNKLQLIDASFIWTEPHSKRLKLKLTIQKEVMGGTLLQQSFVVEYVVNGQMCENCHRREAKDFWNSVVQVRQKAEHKKTFFYLEQILIKHKAHSNCVNIKPIHDGLDFFFDKKDDARKLVDFLQTVVPCRYNTSQRLISHDIHSNTFNYKSTFSVEIVPICKDDVVCLSREAAHTMGNIGQLCVVIRVTNIVYLIDPFTLRTAEVSANVYFRSPFRCICNSKHLTEYIVMNIELIKEKEGMAGNKSVKFALSDIWLTKASELGSGDQIHSKTHIGHLLNVGDTVLAFDIASANINDPNFEKYENSSGKEIPDCLIVKKHYGDKVNRNRKRQWKLRRLNMEGNSSGASVDGEFMDFMEDLEEDQIIRQNVNIYADKEKTPCEDADDDDDNDLPKITLQEMLQDLNIDQEK